MPFSGFPGYPHSWTYRTYFMASFSLSAAAIALLFVALYGIDRYLYYRTRKRAHSVLYRALSLAAPRSEIEAEIPQRMVDLDFAETRRESIRVVGTSRLQRCCRVAQYFSVILFMLSSVLLWIVFCLFSFADDTWVYRWLSVGLFWAAFAFSFFFFSSITFFAVLRRFIPLMVAFFLSLSVMQASTWDYWEPWLVSIIITVIMFLGAWPLTSNMKMDHVSQQHTRFHRARLAFSKHKVMFPVVCAMILAFTIGAPITTAGTCVSFYNDLTPGVGLEGVHWSTRVSRSYEPVPCPEGQLPCHVYLTAAKYISTSVYVNAHTHPSVQSVNVSYWQNASDTVVSVRANRFAITGLEKRGDRAIHSILLNNLTPETVYYFLVQGDSTVRKFRTGPGGMNPYRFASGGDIGNTDAGVQITARTAEMDPLFVIAGGDLAYSNGLRSCYPCWDKWLHSIPTSPDGFNLQILTVTGNHDTGSNSMDNAFDGIYSDPIWKGDDVDVPLFFFLFPHHESSDATSSSPPPVSQRKPYHAHWVGNSSLFLVLDSGHVTGYQNQADWMERQLQSFNLSTAGKSSLKVVVYHVPFYAFPSGGQLERGAVEGKASWIPIFDKYHVHVAFENHVHAFKRTFALKHDQVNPNGTVYLGDGYWGISPHDELSGLNEGSLSHSLSPRLAIGGLRYHIWRGDVYPADGGLMLTAVGHNGPFDCTNVSIT